MALGKGLEWLSLASVLVLFLSEIFSDLLGDPTLERKLSKTSLFHGFLRVKFGKFPANPPTKPSLTRALKGSELQRQPEVSSRFCRNAVNIFMSFGLL